ncbi:MAG: hypothetical protein RJA81_1597 [Planctomycetota bacterium]|jgi:uncharacterized membrane protein (UPF0136 family)
MTPKIASVILLIYAMLLVAGGWIGYLKAKSKPSLIAGHVSGLLIIVSILIMIKGGQLAPGGCILASLTAFLLTIFFGKRFAKTRKLMPAGMMAVVSAIIFLAVLLAFPQF